MVATRFLIAIFSLMPLSTWADVLPTRRGPDAEERRTVEVRLASLGARGPDAQGLTIEEARYFAGAPERVQVVGHGYEAIWGVGLGCLLLILLIAAL